MIKEYRDNFLGDSATDKLNKDIKHNPGIGFNIVGYSQTIQQNGLPIILSSILVMLDDFFSDAE